MVEFKQPKEILFEKAGRKAFGLMWEASEQSAVALYLHGAFSHAGEAITFASYAVTQGMTVYAFDLPGWGHVNVSKTKRGHIQSYEEYLDWIRGFKEFVLEDSGASEIYLVGHSMGGLLAFLTSLHDQSYKAVVLSSPWFATAARIPWVLQTLAKVFNKIWPTFASKATFKLEELTHDKEILKMHERDIASGVKIMKATVRWLHSIEEAQTYCMTHASEATLPTLFLGAEKDTLVSVEAIQEVYERTGSEIKNFEIYQNAFHELFNETFRERVFTDVFQWIFTI